MADILEQALAELAAEAALNNIPLIIGGGYGVVLRTVQIRNEGIRTLRPVPEARATSDIDLFLPVELIIDGPRIQRLRDILAGLDYRVVKGAEYYQFIRGSDAASTVKIDILAALPRHPEQRELVKQRNRRVRPKGVELFHAHVAPEAIGITEYAVPIMLDGGAQVHVPHPFSYIVLKLFALRDRMESGRRDMGIIAKHALDIYGLIAMITEPQWREALDLQKRFPDPDIALEARRIVHALFGNDESAAMLALRAQASAAEIRPDDLSGFLRDLHELFPLPAEDKKRNGALR